MLSLEKTFREKLLDMYKTAPLDAASFHRHYKACGIGECFGLCCNGGSGFYLPEEAETIESLVKNNRAFFEKHLGSLPEKVIDEEIDEETGESSPTTAIREAPYPDGFLPPHFPSTACVFKRNDGACTLQLLGIEEGKSGWAYKPVACWLFPIELEHDGKPYIHMAHESMDEYIDDEYPGFTGFTKCGAECKSGGGKPAYEAVAGELAALSKLIDRDLLSEILAYKKESA